jgi:hypothetical protein
VITASRTTINQEDIQLFEENMLYEGLCRKDSQDFALYEQVVEQVNEIHEKLVVLDCGKDRLTGGVLMPEFLKEFGKDTVQNVLFAMLILSYYGKIFSALKGCWRFACFLREKFLKWTEPAVTFTPMNIDAGAERLMPNSAFLPAKEQGHKFQARISVRGKHIGYATTVWGCIVTPTHVLTSVKETGSTRFELTLGEKSAVLDVGHFRPLYSDLSYANFPPGLHALLGLRKPTICPPVDGFARIEAMEETAQGDIGGTKSLPICQHDISTKPGFSGASIMIGTQMVAIHIGATNGKNTGYWAQIIENALRTRVVTCKPESADFEAGHGNIMTDADKAAQFAKVQQKIKLSDVEFFGTPEQPREFQGASRWADEVDFYEQYEPEALNPTAKKTRKPTLLQQAGKLSYGDLSPEMKKAIAEIHSTYDHAGSASVVSTDTDADAFEMLTERVNRLEAKLEELALKVQSNTLVAKTTVAPVSDKIKCAYCDKKMLESKLKDHLAGLHKDKLMELYEQRKSELMPNDLVGESAVPDMAGGVFAKEAVAEGKTFLGERSAPKNTKNSKKTSNTSVRAGHSTQMADIQKSISDLRRLLDGISGVNQQASVGRNQAIMRS